MSVEAWANTARRDRYRQHSEHQRAIDAFQGLLEGNTTPDATADTIASLYEALIKHPSITTSVATLWGILCDAIRALGGDKELSERLVDLLNSTSRLPDVTDEHGNALTPDWKSAGVYWRSLPELAMMFREYSIGKRSTCGECTKHDCLIAKGPMCSMSRHRARRRDRWQLGCSGRAFAQHDYLWRNVSRER